VRDVLLSRVPAILLSDVYGAAALAGAAVMAISRKLGIPPTLAAIVGDSFWFALRIVAVWRHWNLPKIHSNPADNGRRTVGRARLWRALMFPSVPSALCSAFFGAGLATSGWCRVCRHPYSGITACHANQ